MYKNFFDGQIATPFIILIVVGELADLREVANASYLE